MFVTFYSYKGGVGRSMALANIACLLAEDETHPQRVLLWDFDLEAPGLHRLFLPQEPRRYGFVDLAYEFATTGELPKVSDYIYQSLVTGVDVLPAGFVGESYCDRLQRIDWVQFFASSPTDEGPFFGPLLKHLREQEYDYVLIDSRTGLHDQAGICTQLLPDMLVVLFRLTDQNLDGLEHVVPAIRAQQKLRGKERILTLPIASGVTTNAPEEVCESRDQALHVFDVDQLDYIRFDQDLARDEKLFCLKSHRTAMWPIPSIVADYKNLCSTIRARNPNDTQTAIEKLDDKLWSRDLASAASLLKPLLIRRPRIPQLWATLHRLCEEGALRHNEVDSLVERILKDDQDNTFAYEWKARRHLLKADSTTCDDLERALVHVRRALELDPKRTGLHRLTAQIAKARGTLEEAVQTLRHAHKLAPGNAQVLLDLVMLYLRRGSDYFASALDHLAELPAELGGKHILTAYLRAFLGDHQESRMAFQSYEEHEEQWHRKRMHRAHLDLIQGRRQDALQSAEEALKSSEMPPNNTDKLNWAEFFICAEDFRRAEELIDDASSHKEEPNLCRALGTLAGYLDGVDPEISTTEVLKSWHPIENWNFCELLLFRARAKREGRTTTLERLDVLEEMIRQDELRRATHPASGFLVRLGRRRVKRKRMVSASAHR